MPTTQNSASTITWLDSIGSADRGDTVKMNNVGKALVELAGFCITEAEKNAQAASSIATGRIVSSMDAGPIETMGKKTSIAIEIDKNYKWTDKGVKGVESGKSYAGFSFKTKYPNKKMATAILRWLGNRRRRGRIKYKAVSKNEKKNKDIHKKVTDADSLKGMAYGIATNIKKHGIDGTQWFTKAVSSTEKKAGSVLGNAIKLDIIESLKNI